MELPPLLQLMQLGAALGLGAGLGLIYDLLRAVRRSLARRAWGFDLLYCLCCLAALFLLGMGSGDGQLRIFMAVAAALGVAIYLAIISPFVLPCLLQVAHIILLPAIKAKKMLKYFSVFCKKLFQSRIKWFKIKCKSHKAPERDNPRQTDSEEEALNGTQNRYGCGAAPAGSRSLRGAQPHRSVPGARRRAG